MSRHDLLRALQERAAGLGVGLKFPHEAPPDEELQRYDLLIAADGVNRATRSRQAEVCEPTLEQDRCRYMWLGTPLVVDAFKFFIVETEFGVFQIHAYPYSRLSLQRQHEYVHTRDQ
jgi:anthraniloyl-CoA monooxygenase